MCLLAFILQHNVNRQTEREEETERARWMHNAIIDWNGNEGDRDQGGRVSADQEIKG